VIPFSRSKGKLKIQFSKSIEFDDKTHQIKVDGVIIEMDDDLIDMFITTETKVAEENTTVECQHCYEKINVKKGNYYPRFCFYCSKTIMYAEDKETDEYADKGSVNSESKNSVNEENGNAGDNTPA